MKGKLLLEKERAARNRTISLSEQEIAGYGADCADISALRDISLCLDQIIWGDTFAALPFLPEGVIDLLLVDPPYNLSKTYGEDAFKKMPADEYAQFTEAWINLVRPKLKQTASLYVCCDWKSSLIIGPILQNYFLVQNRITWQREKGRGAKQNWKNTMEDIWFATCSKDYVFNVEEVKMRRKVLAPYKIGGRPKDWIQTAEGNYRDTYPSNFWDDISIPYWSMPENTDHPTQKPEKLMAKLILASSHPGDIILDPFIGSGTTAVVAKKLDRHFIGIEAEKTYCAMAQKRLTLAERDLSIQGYADGVFWERNTFISHKTRAALQHQLTFDDIPPTEQ